ncbi:helix-turn-helix transcriptional regulator [Flavobacterium sp. xlx-214]|uniref:helix-turn-helix domain-containing protein n=1 Tax=unclassified Flavobacterium TaxID=196869 RepID=UPI0013D5D63C|nr:MULTISPECIES: helix-turn-helix transcriptional regulator [unclassified Flavobacterium]MBA5792523.1 helix-turn-helix transcriptional regulator [Flavobacterium sp. xlx-221]QMI82325.1 helix-turn-helix transcriptional regulator [Flavobacterium sp. xlx-214]
MYNKLFIFLFFLFCHVAFCQNNVDAKKQQIFNSLDKKILTNAATIYSNGVSMLQYAQTDKEKSRAYHVMGDGKYKDGDYLTAIENLEKANQYAYAAKATDIQVAIKSLLVYTYRYAGLTTESDAALKEVYKLSNLNNGTQLSQALQANATALEIDKKFCEALVLRKKELLLYQSKVAFDNEFQKNSILIFSNIHVGYLNLKCNNINDALQNIEKADSIYAFLGTNKPTYYIEHYYLDKALISLINKDSIAAKDWFLKSYESVKKTENKFALQKILNEMKESGVFNDPTSKNKILEELLSINNYQTINTKEITKYETAKNNQNLKEQHHNNLILLIGLGILLLVLFLIIYFYKKRNKLIHEKYQNIINAINQNKAITENREIKNNLDDENTEQQPKEVIKNNETEHLILKNLLAFENANKFTTKSISVSKMATLLKTNPKYVTYILKKHRNADFHTYINTQRINYIITLLQNDPKILNYKIAVLSDMCGYNTHSQFASIFKSQTGISPSQFINEVKKSHK